MDRSPNSTHQQSRQVLDQALAILGLPLAPALPTITRILELEHTVRALVTENRRLRRQLATFDATRDTERAGRLAGADEPEARGDQTGI